MANRTRVTDPLDQAQLAGFAARKRERCRLELEDLLEAVDWALRHPASDPEPYAAAQTAQRVVGQGWVAEHDAKLDVQGHAATEVFDDPWTPLVDWSAFAPMAAAMGRSTVAGKSLVNDGLVLACRLPRLFEAVRGGRVEVWRARRIAQAVRMRPADVCDEVDEKVTPLADSIGLSKLEAIIDEAMLRLHVEERELEIEEARESYGIELYDSFHGFHGGENVPVAELRICGDVKDLGAFEAMASKIARILGEQQHAEGLLPESLEVRKARAVGILADPQLALELLNGGTLENARTIHGIQLIVHMTPDQATALTGGQATAITSGFDPVVRVDSALRARLAEQVATWCNRPESAFTVLPVVDLAQHAASTSTSVTEDMARRAKLRTPTCVFPFCDRPSRACDIDHRIPAGEGLGQHGATCDCNLTPLCRHHHRLKTFAGWYYTPIEEAVWLWTDPHGRSYLRDHHTTRDVTVDDDPVLIANANWTQRRDELRRQRIPIGTGCRKIDEPTHEPVNDPPPF